MRTIKFRGETRKREWVYGDLLHAENNVQIVKWDECSHIVSGETIGQFTGLYDTNGEELYEGDIVKGKAIIDEGSFDYLGVVKWYSQNDAIGWFVEDADGAAWELKQIRARRTVDYISGAVIGNIHDNPELLKQ